MSEEYVPLLEAAAYLGVSRVKLSRLVKEGVLTAVSSPLDKRLKLFKRSDLEVLRQAPRRSAPGPSPVLTD
ncbi:MAG: helix-turn-helix domain-containing protein [Chloroflexota bacterium]